MTQKVIIGLTGIPGSGKSEAAKYLAEHWNFTLFEGSSIIKKHAIQTNTTLTERADYDRYYRSQQQHRGLDWLAQLALNDPRSRVAHVGLRNYADNLTIRRASGLIIALQCPDELGFERTDKTNPKNAQTLEEFIDTEAALESSNEYGIHLKRIIDEADIKIDATQPLSVVHAELDAVVGDYIASQH